MNIIDSDSQQIKKKLEAIDWADIRAQLAQSGCAHLRQILTPQICNAFIHMYPQDERFRSHIHMARHGLGQGEYKYFRYPLPDMLATLRHELYPELAKIANQWNILMNIETRYPAAHLEYLDACHQAGQVRPTPLLLQYQAGDYNCLHQDLYGERVFPLQVAFMPSSPGEDFTGGEFVMTEQRPRMQTRPEVVNLQKGDAVIFAVSHRPVQGTRGIYRVNMRHGVSKIRRGHRHTLGVIFHDAQ